MREQIKKLFIDIDECTCSSLYANNEKHADQLLETYGKHWEGKKYTLGEGTGWNCSIGWYVSFIRPWAYKLIDWAQETYGEDNVYILSMGTCDYVNKVVKELDLYIKPENIYGREDIHYPKYSFDDSNNVLIDNENYYYHSAGHYNKVNFLGKIPIQKLVEIDDFDVRVFDPKKDENYLDVVKEEIVKAFEWKSID